MLNKNKIIFSEYIIQTVKVDNLSTAFGCCVLAITKIIITIVSHGDVYSFTYY